MPSPASKGTAAPLPLAARRHPLVAQIERALRFRCEFDLKRDLVVAVSGGADSLALLLSCVVLRNRQESAGAFRPIAVHVHHHLRTSADDDAQHVLEVCRRFDVPCELRHIAPGELPGNLSANARRLRYEALAHAAGECGAAHIATAHHAEDQLETMLAALCRGAGAEAVAGMRWSRPLNETVNLIRPMLGLTKADCVDLCLSAEIGWRDDPTNEDVTYARARLRRDVLPVLEALWPGAAQRASSSAEIAALAADALEEKLEMIFGHASKRTWPRQAVASQPAALIAAGLRRAAMAAGVCATQIIQRQLIVAAEAVKDDDRRPRHFAISGLCLHITAHEVRLENHGNATA